MDGPITIMEGGGEVPQSQVLSQVSGPRSFPREHPSLGQEVVPQSQVLSQVPNPRSFPGGYPSPQYRVPPPPPVETQIPRLQFPTGGLSCLHKSLVYPSPRTIPLV